MASNEQTAARTDIFVSVIAVLDHSVADAEGFIRNLHATVSSRYANYEVLLVDNAAPTEQIAGVRDLLQELPCIRVLRLSRHFTIDTAIFAGLEAAIGDFVVIMTPAYDPIDAVPEIVELSRRGADVVQGLSDVPIGGGWISRAGRSVFYWYNRRFLDIDITPRATYLTGLTRRAVNSLTTRSRSQRYLRHLIRHVGYRIADFRYTPLEGPARRRTVKAGYVEAMEMISSYSTHPLRVVTVVGVLAALFNLLYAAWVVVANLVLTDVAEGWTTTSLQLSLMFVVICSILAVQAEYVGRILTESRKEPSYYIMEELESETLIADLERRNVSE